MADIYQTLNEVAKDIGAIGKNRRNDFHRFNFRGIDDVYNIVGPALHRHGVTAFPQVLQAEEMPERTTKDGGAMLHVRLTVGYTFVAVDGSRHDIVVVADAMDTGDKAVSKAMSMAYKTAMLQTLCIPVEGEPDPDAESPEVVSRDRRGATPADPAKAAHAKTAAKQQDFPVAGADDLWKELYALLEAVRPNEMKVDELDATAKRLYELAHQLGVDASFKANEDATSEAVGAEGGWKGFKKDEKVLCLSMFVNEIKDAVKGMK